jgi:hypothetical protein
MSRVRPASRAPLPSGATRPLLAPVLAALSLAAALPTAAVHAQGAPVPPWERRSAPTFALGAAGVYASPRGSGPTRVADGAGFEAQGMLGVGALALGVGYQRTVQPVRAAGVDATYDGVFVEPRVAVAPFRNFNPYLAGRVSFLRQRVPGTTRNEATRANTTALGGGIGTLVSLAPNVQLDLAALYQHVAAGDAATGEARAPLRAGGGNGALLRAGVVLGFDRWGALSGRPDRTGRPIVRRGQLPPAIRASVATVFMLRAVPRAAAGMASRERAIVSRSR